MTSFIYFSDSICFILLLIDFTVFYLILIFIDFISVLSYFIFCVHCFSVAFFLSYPFNLAVQHFGNPVFA